MLRQRIYEEMVAAMKARDQVTLSAVRFVWSEIKRIEIDAKHELTDEEVVEMLRREIKRRKEAIELFKTGGREELAHDDQVQLEIIEKYVPQQMQVEEVEKVVKVIVDSGLKDMGKVMREVMNQLKGKADGKMVADVVKKMLV